MGIYFQIIWNRIGYLILTLVVAITAIVLLTMTIKPYYKATTKLLIAPFGLGVPDYGTYVYYDQVMSTFSAVLNSDQVILAAEQSLKIDELPQYSVDLIPRSELLQISATSTDPLLAQETANILATILIEKTQSQYGVNLENIGETLDARLTELEDEINSLIRETTILENQLPRDNVRIAEISRLLTLRETTYNMLVERRNQTLIGQAEQENLVSIFEPAVLPLEPDGPKMKLNIILGVIAGLVGGLVVVFVIEILNPKLYSQNQIQEVLQSEIIGKIPKFHKRFWGNVFQANGDSYAIESFRRLRTHIETHIEAKRGNPQITASQKTIVVLSSYPNEGKSTLVVNLAIASAHNFRRVILIDGDVYQPSIHHLLKLENKSGLTELLQGKSQIEEVIQRTEINNLHVITAGSFMSQSAEWFGSNMMTQIIEKLDADYDLIMFDAPPILAVTDGLVLAHQSYGSVVVIRENMDKNFALKAMNELEKVDIKPIGIVMNGMRRDKMSGWTTKYIKRKMRNA